MASTSQVKDRGAFLTLMILFLGLGVIFTLYLLDPQASIDKYGYIPSWIYPYGILLILGALAVMYGMWNLKKWAVFMLAALFIIQLGFSLFVTNYGIRAIAYISPIQTLIQTAIGVGLWYWAIKRKWTLFN